MNGGEAQQPTESLQLSMVPDSFEVLAGEGMLTAHLQPFPVVSLALNGIVDGGTTPVTAKVILNPTQAEQMAIKLIVGAWAARRTVGET